MVDADYSDDDIYNESRARPLPEKATPFSRLFGHSDNLQQRIERKKRGIGRQKYPVVGEKSVVSWVFMLVTDECA